MFRASGADADAEDDCERTDANAVDVGGCGCSGVKGVRFVDGVVGSNCCYRPMSSDT